MIIAQEKRKSNIAEFILYMWQVEDLIRASRFDLERVDQIVISKFDLPGEKLDEIRTWYSNLITLMAEEKIAEKGHMSFLNKLIGELNDLHLRLLQAPGEKKYQELYKIASPNIKSFMEKHQFELEAITPHYMKAKKMHNNVYQTLAVHFNFCAETPKDNTVTVNAAIATKIDEPHHHVQSEAQFTRQEQLKEGHEIETIKKCLESTFNQQDQYSHDLIENK